MAHMDICRACTSSDMYVFLELGSHPPANRFLDAAQLGEPEPSFPLDAHVCLNCALIQVPNYITADFFRHYVYMPSASSTLQAHFAGLAETLTSRLMSDGGDLIVDITHGATTVRLVDRPGRPPQGMNVGCGADVACVRPVILDDDGGGIPIECAAPANCGTCFPNSQVPGASYLPNEALTAFDTADQAGEWIIGLSDNAALDVGTLCAWEVRTTCEAQSVEPTTWGSIKARYGE